MRITLRHHGEGTPSQMTCPPTVDDATGASLNATLLHRQKGLANIYDGIGESGLGLRDIQGYHVHS